MIVLLTHKAHDDVTNIKPLQRGLHNMIIDDLKKEIQLLKHLKTINYTDTDINYGMNYAYDIAIMRLEDLIKKYE